ncbi:MAG: 30S ribosomal protein S2 [Bernardetiaceae bacterium]|nr:30S ribosomal protein S2 [Bernardetiaceae bacterium]
MQVEYKELLSAGVHFGHLKRKWNPKMAPYIFMERNGIHIVDLNKTRVSLEAACNAARNFSKRGNKILFVATKKQAQEVVREEAKRLNMPYVTDRWLGGMLTNFATIRKSIKKMQSMDKMMKSDNYKNLAKRERLMVERERNKLERVLGGIADMSKLPSAIFVVDIVREHIAIKEARKLNIPVIAVVDTNGDPDLVQFPIPGNDDAYKSISLLTSTIGRAIEEGAMERKQEKEEAKLAEEEEKKRLLDEKKNAEMSDAEAAREVAAAKQEETEEDEE